MCLNEKTPMYENYNESRNGTAYEINVTTEPIFGKDGSSQTKGLTNFLA